LFAAGASAGKLSGAAAFGKPRRCLEQHRTRLRIAADTELWNEMKL
jgi:hypothetical protein